MVYLCVIILALPGTHPPIYIVLCTFGPSHHCSSQAELTLGWVHKLIGKYMQIVHQTQMQKHDGMMVAS